MSESSISSAVTSALAEEKDGEKWRLNLIVHNVVEFTAENGQAREKEDIDKVFQFFHKILRWQLRWLML